MSSPVVINLPPKIESAISELLASVALNTWTKSALKLSDKYRLNRETENVADKVFVNNREDVLGYISLRATSTYAQLYGAMCDASQMIPSWKPLSILDIGSGPGPAVWAASKIWPSINKITCLERDGNFSKVGKEILKSTVPKPVSIDWKTIDLSVSKPEIDAKYDLVTMGSVLNEMTAEQQADILNFAYYHCQGVLLVVEPGTPYGFETTRQTSILFDSRKKVLIAPYINNGFVSSSQDPIGFAQKIIRPEFLKRIRQIQRKFSSAEDKPLLPASDWEEAKYAYVALSMLPPEISPWARLIAKPTIAKGYIELKILTQDKVETIKILKSDKAHYKLAKKLKWGDLIATAI